MKDRLALIDRVGPLATSSQQRYGVPASVTIAQAILESSWGRSALTQQARNWFGIKAREGERYKAFSTAEYFQGKRQIVPAKFRDFVSDGECFDEHGRLLAMSKRYAPAMAVADDPLAFAAKLQQCGYATDPMYANELAALINQYNLTRFDVKRPKVMAVNA